MTANHPAAPVIWGNTVEATGLTKREWLMARFPMSVDEFRSALSGKKTSLPELMDLYAACARLWADAIIKEAARDD